MKLKELLVEKLMNTSLFEMAIQQKMALRKINSMSTPIVELYLKIVYLDSPNDLRHWISNLHGSFKQLQKIKLDTTNWHPTPDQYYNWLLFSEEDWSEGAVRSEFLSLTDKRFGKYSEVPLKKEFNPTEAWMDIQRFLNPKTSKLFVDMYNNKFTTILDYLDTEEPK